MYHSIAFLILPSIKKKRKQTERKQCNEKFIYFEVLDEKSILCEHLYMSLNQKEEVHGCVLFYQTMKCKRFIRVEVKVIHT